MWHRWYYDFDNYDDMFVCLPAVRHGACFEFMNCRIKFYTLHEYEILIEVEGNNLSKDEAENICEQVGKILTVLFALPLHGGLVYKGQSHKQLQVNKLLSRSSRHELMNIERKVKKYNSIKTFYSDMLDLMVVAYDNLYRYREEEAFVYFFKAVERIAKEYYITYMQRHHTKALTSKNKYMLRNFLDTYGLTQLGVKLTPDMLDRKTDMFYKELKMEFHGSVYGKISLFVNKTCINVNVSDISMLIKLRNRLAHGDTVAKEDLIVFLGVCEVLAVEMFSKYFFRKNYREIHLKSYRYEYGVDVYED